MNSAPDTRRVLIIEADVDLGKFLTKSLQSENYEVVWLRHWRGNFESGPLILPDLVILGIAQCDCTGVELIAKTRAAALCTSIMVISKFSSASDRIRCLNLGADALLCKPFNSLELLAFCRSMVRRQNQFVNPVKRFGGVTIDQIHRVADFRGTELNLTTKEFRLLECLVEAQGVCCSRAHLYRHVWQFNEKPNTNVLDVYIRYLRMKLDLASPRSNCCASPIETERSHGYRLRNWERFLENEVDNHPSNLWDANSGVMDMSKWPVQMSPSLSTSEDLTVYTPALCPV